MGREYGKNEDLDYVRQRGEKERDRKERGGWEREREKEWKRDSDNKILKSTSSSLFIHL